MSWTLKYERTDKDEPESSSLLSLLLPGVSLQTISSFLQLSLSAAI